MLAVVLKRSFDFALHQIQETLSYADAYELRLDTFKTFNSGEIRELLKKANKISIFSLRKENQGGWFSNDDEKRLAVLLPLLELSPTYVDLEYNTPIEHIELIREKFPHIKIMISYHDFRSSSEDLHKLADRVFKIKADAYKLVTTARSALDSIKMLKISYEYHKRGIPFVGVCMGDLGYLTRLLGPVVGHLFDFASSSEEGKSAPGQYTAEELHKIYNYHQLNIQTAVYALIGHPVEQSISHISHNRVFNACKLNAVYVKIDLEADELHDFLEEIKELPFKGLSVTTPFKEKVFTWLDDVDIEAKNIGAINTLVKKEDHFKGYNTDSTGAIDALEQKIKVQGKKILILGAGGTARAIAYEAIKRGASVSVINRTEEKAISLAKKLGCSAYGFHEIDDALEDGYDILINATLLGMTPYDKQSPIALNSILPKTVVMDIVTKPKHTKFLEDARSKGCILIYGYEIFINQGTKQFALWFPGNVDQDKVKTILEECYLEQMVNDS